MELRPKQAELVDWLDTRWATGYSNVIWMMRSGKTLPICEFLASRVGPEMRCAIVCPPAVVPVWDKHLWEVEHPNMPKIEIISTGALSTNGKIPKGRFDIVVVDEIHQFRANSKRYKALCKLSKGSEYRLALTGTPIDQHLSEMFYPLSWLSNDTFFGEKVTQKAFRATYCYAVSPHLGIRSKWEVRDDIREEFKKAIYEVSSIWKDEDVNPPTHKQVFYPVTRKQKALAQNLADGVFKTLRIEYGVEFGGMELAHRRDKIRQIYGGFLIDELSEVIPNACTTWKWWHLTKLVNQIGHERLVVWYRYVWESQLAKVRLERVFNARVEMFTQSNLAKFNHDQIDVLLCHPLSAGAGIDISHAEKTIFLSPTPNYTALMQAFYRLADRSQQQKLVYHLIADHPVDKMGFEKIWEKEATTEEVYEGAYE